MKIQQADTVSAMAKEAGISREQARIAYKTLFQTIKDNVRDGDISIYEFGVFSIVNRAAGISRSLLTGALTPFGETKLLKFKMSKKFRTEINN